VVHITISSSAVAGFRDVTLSTGTEAAVLLRSFFVAPIVRRISETIQFGSPKSAPGSKRTVNATINVRNLGASFSGNFKVFFSTSLKAKHVTFVIVRATLPIRAKGTQNGQPYVTLGRGLKKGQTVSISLRMTYPKSLSLNSLSRLLRVTAS